MANQHSALRFDHREIAVIFSLFIFTSLLMFTVGIMVGKGIAQAKYEGGPGAGGDLGHTGLRLPSSEVPHTAIDSALGTSISTDHPKKTESPATGHGEEHGAEPAHGAAHSEPHAENQHDVSPHGAEHGLEKGAEHTALAPKENQKETEKHGKPSLLAAKDDHKKSALAAVTEQVTESAHPAGIANDDGEEEENKEVSPSAKLKALEEAKAAKDGEKVAAKGNEDEAPGDLELIPEKPKTGDLRGSLSDFAKKEEVDAVLKKPKIKDIFEKETPGGSSRKITSLSKPTTTSKSLGKFPASFAEGHYTVQVGSYPTKQDATSRVTSLKQLGFKHAYISSKELGDKKDTWYRVWLGYFPDADSAKASGELLQTRGEVKSYLVRRTDTKED